MEKRGIEVDTPGLLDRPIETRNKVELQAIIALKHLSDVMIFLFDISKNAISSIEEQTNLLNEIIEFYPAAEFIIALTKNDLISENEVENFTQRIRDSKIIESESQIFSISTKTKNGVPNLTDYIERKLLRIILVSIAFSIQ